MLLVVVSLSALHASLSFSKVVTSLLMSTETCGQDPASFAAILSDQVNKNDVHSMVLVQREL